jgi:hypothetical protein
MATHWRAPNFLAANSRRSKRDLVSLNLKISHAAPKVTKENQKAHHHNSAFFTFDARATHAHKLLPAALASVPTGFVLVRV